jgi:hypothetical protein
MRNYAQVSDSMSYSEMPPPDSRHSSPQKEGGEAENPHEEDSSAKERLPDQATALFTQRIGELKDQKSAVKKLLEKYRKKIKYANESENESLALELKKEAKAHEETLADL